MRATGSGTRRFAARFPNAHRQHFKRVRGLTISSIGIGTYRGSARASFDRAAVAAIEVAVANGCNLIDTARNYRGGRSEVVVGKAIRALIAAGIVRRDELIVCSKAGYLAEPQSSGANGVMSRVDANCLGWEFLRSQVMRSLERSGLQVIDIYLLHNPEVHIPALGRRKFYWVLARCFEAMERHVLERKIGTYGLACWSAFEPRSAFNIDLARALAAARSAAGGDDHHFGAIETPLNWMYRTAPLMSAGHGRRGSVASPLIVLGSSALYGGRFARLPAVLASAMKGTLTDAQRSIHFARSLPGVTAALVGMNRKAHIEENLRLRELPRLPETFVTRLCAALERVT